MSETAFTETKLPSALAVEDIDIEGVGRIERNQELIQALQKIDYSHPSFVQQVMDLRNMVLQDASQPGAQGVLMMTQHVKDAEALEFHVIRAALDYQQAQNSEDQRLALDNYRRARAAAYNSLALYSRMRNEALYHQLRNIRMLRGVDVISQSTIRALEGNPSRDNFQAVSNYVKTFQRYFAKESNKMIKQMRASVRRGATDTLRKSTWYGSVKRSFPSIQMWRTTPVLSGQSKYMPVTVRRDGVDAPQLYKPKGNIMCVVKAPDATWLQYLIERDHSGGQLVPVEPAIWAGFLASYADILLSSYYGHGTVLTLWIRIVQGLEASGFSKSLRLGISVPDYKEEPNLIMSTLSLDKTVKHVIRTKSAKHSLARTVREDVLGTTRTVKLFNYTAFLKKPYLEEHLAHAMWSKDACAVYLEDMGYGTEQNIMHETLLGTKINPINHLEGFGFVDWYDWINTIFDIKINWTAKAPYPFVNEKKGEVWDPIVELTGQMWDDARQYGVQYTLKRWADNDTTRIIPKKEVYDWKAYQFQASGAVLNEHINPDLGHYQNFKRLLRLTKLRAVFSPPLSFTATHPISTIMKKTTTYFNDGTLASFCRALEDTIVIPRVRAYYTRGYFDAFMRHIFGLYFNADGVVSRFTMKKTYYHMSDNIFVRQPTTGQTYQDRSSIRTTATFPQREFWVRLSNITHDQIVDLLGNEPESKFAIFVAKHLNGDGSVTLPDGAWAFYSLDFGRMEYTIPKELYKNFLTALCDRFGVKGLVREFFIEFAGKNSGHTRAVFDQFCIIINAMFSGHTHTVDFNDCVSRVVCKIGAEHGAGPDGLIAIARSFGFNLKHEQMTLFMPGEMPTFGGEEIVSMDYLGYGLNAYPYWVVAEGKIHVADEEREDALQHLSYLLVPSLENSRTQKSDMKGDTDPRDTSKFKKASDDEKKLYVAAANQNSTMMAIAMFFYSAWSRPARAQIVRDYATWLQDSGRWDLGGVEHSSELKDKKLKEVIKARGLKALDVSVALDLFKPGSAPRQESYAPKPPQTSRLEGKFSTYNESFSRIRHTLLSGGMYLPDFGSRTMQRTATPVTEREMKEARVILDNYDVHVASDKVLREHLQNLFHGEFVAKKTKKKVFEDFPPPKNKWGYESPGVPTEVKSTAEVKTDRAKLKASKKAAKAERVKKAVEKGRGVVYKPVEDVKILQFRGKRFYPLSSNDIKENMIQGLNFTNTLTSEVGKSLKKRLKNITTVKQGAGDVLGKLYHIVDHYYPSFVERQSLRGLPEIKLTVDPVLDSPLRARPKESSARVSRMVKDTLIDLLISRRLLVLTKGGRRYSMYRNTSKHHPALLPLNLAVEILTTGLDQD